MSMIMCLWAVKHLCEWMTADVRACVRLSMHEQLSKAVGPGLSCDTPSRHPGRWEGAWSLEGGLQGVVCVVDTETNLGHDRGTGGRGNA